MKAVLGALPAHSGAWSRRVARRRAGDWHGRPAKDPTDIPRTCGYTNPARHVRAFGVGWNPLEMTGSTRSSDGLDDRRKRLLFRCWHRGTREMDLLLGRFADAAIAELSDTELAELERLIEVPDPDLYAALSSEVLLGPEFRTRLFD